MTLYLNYWTLVSFCLMTITAPYWPVLPSWPAFVLCLAVLLLSVQYRKVRCLLGLVFAFIVIIFHGNVLKTQTETLFHAGQDITIKGEVDSFFKANNFGYQGIILIRSINGRRLNTFSQPKVRLTSPVKHNLGETIFADISVKPIHGLMNGVGFDAEKHAFSVGVVGSATLSQKQSFYTVSGQSLRQSTVKRLAEYTDLLKLKGVIEALVFGSRNNISLDTWQGLQQTGLSHLIAISGLHIGIVFGIGWWVGLCFLRLVPVGTYAPIIFGVVCAFCYAGLAGFSLPTVRALIMCCIFCFYQRRWGNVPASYKWLSTLTVLLCIEPFSTVSSSIWLSMSAVGVILIFLSLRSLTSSLLIRLVLMQVLISIAMAPITALLFNGLSLASVVYNLVFVPWFSLVVIPMVFIALSLTILGVDVAWLWRMVDVSLVPMMSTLEWADWGWISLSDRDVSFVMLVVVFAFIAVFVKRNSLLIIAVVLSFVWVDWKPKPQWQLTILDVGHGLSVVIRQGSKTMIYDTGAAWQSSSIARRLLTPYLQVVGTNSLDYLVLSHFDNDHAGDWQYVEQKWQANRVIASQRVPGAIPCVRGNHWQWDNLQIEALWPPTITRRAYNPHSCVLKITHQTSGFSVLLTGDVERVAEWILVRAPEALKADVVLVPHHGSQTSSIVPFVAANDAKWAVASTAKNGRWNLPKPQVVERYRKQGAQWMDTGNFGRIMFNFYTNKIEVDALRLTKGQSWYRQMLRKGVE